MGIFRNILKLLFHWESDKTTDPTLNSIRVNPITLKFPKILEESFLKYYYKSTFLQTKISAVSGAFLFAVFFPFDLFLVPELFWNFLILRIGLGSSIIFSAILIVERSKNKKISQPILSLAVIAIGAINVSFIVQGYPKLNSYYYVGIILIYFWGYTFLKLRFLWASFAGLSIFFLYLFATKIIVNIEQELFLVSSSYILGANFAGILVAYALEYYSRWDYIQTLKLKRSLSENRNLHRKITESDKAIGLAEEKLMLQSQALESAANSISVLNRMGNIIWVNKAFSLSTGFDTEEVIGKNPRILKSGKHDKGFYKNLWTTIMNGKVWSGEIMNKKKNGDNYYEEMIITPVIDSETKKITHFIAIKQDITLRKDMEDELFESEKRLRGLFENASMGIYRSTISGEILMANNALLKMLGYGSEEELKNQNFSSAGYKNPDQRGKFIKEISEKGSLIGFVSEWSKKDGTTIFIRESARVDFDESGKMVFEGTVEDITLSVKAQAETKSASERLQTVFDNLYDAVIIHDTNGKITSVNSKVLDFFNITMDEALATNIKDLAANKSSRGYLEERWQKVLSDNKTFKFEWKVRQPNENYTFDVDVFLSKIDLGNHSFVLANMRDITEQKEANKSLKITQKAVDLNTAPIFWINKDSQFKYVNNAAKELFGYTHEEFLDMSISDIDTMWTKEFWIESGYPMMKEKRTGQFDTVCIKKDSTHFPAEINASIIEYENREVIIAVITDITERKKIAQNMLEAKEKAEQSNKLKSEFLAGMSHEIRTPVNTILNFISLIKSDLGENTTDDINESFEMIDNGSRRLIRTIDSIINMSQLQAGSYDIKEEQLSIAEDILAPLFMQLAPVAEQNNLAFDLLNNCDDSTVLGDQYTITQLFINLIENAIKYTIEGKITVEVSSTDAEIIVNIKDTGVGMSEEFLPTIFDPFMQEEMGYTRSFEGNGLGLALVSKYVELNNGTIKVISEKGVGSTFSVSLPKPQNHLLTVNSTLKKFD